MGWDIEDAGKRLREVVEQARRNGPQAITENGRKVAVLVPAEDKDVPLSAPRQSLLEALKNSPLKDVDLDVDRRSSPPREDFGPDPKENLLSVLRDGVPEPLIRAALWTLAIAPEELDGLMGLTKPGPRAREVALQYRMVCLAAAALETLEDREKVIRWLRKPNRALGGTVPLSLLETEQGFVTVSELLARIDHGIFS